MNRMRLAAVIIGAVAVVAVPFSAHASPAYLTSDPEDGAEMNSAPENVRVVFDQPLEPGGTLIVVDECDRRIDDDSPVVIGSTISVGIEKTPKGEYAAMWKVRAPGGVGGGDATGQIEFTVLGGPSCGPKSDDHSGHGNHGDGKDGHGNHGDGKDGHGNHGGGGDHSNHASGGHSGHGGDSTHSTAGHTGHTDHGGSGDHSEHIHGPGKKVRPGEGDADLASGSDDTPTTVAADLIPAPEEVPGSMVLTALLVSVLLGAGGGWIVRNLTPAG